MRRVGLMVLAVAALHGGTAQAASPAAGTWVGDYGCAQGRTGLTLTIGDDAAGRVRALFYFHAAPGNPAVPDGCFEMSGDLDAGTGHLVLLPGSWRLRPANFVTVGLTGDIGGDGRLTGTISGPGCTGFTLARAPGDQASRLTACDQAVS